VAGIASLVWLLVMSGRAEAQLGALISPGPLARAHAELEGISKCQTCHERGRRVVAEKCLACHQPIADRIARKAGVHRDVKGDCVTCHVEHAGREGELRPFDQRGFDHAGVAGFPLDGKHAPVAGRCEACHKTRSFVTVASTCASCHTDVHKGALGRNCASCHSTAAAFTTLGGAFDHAKAAFRLTGAHRTVACASCHVNKQFKGLKFSTCSDCHTDPHRSVPRTVAAQTVSFASSCATCHTTETWRTTKVNHSQTAFPLVGRHAGVECAACHRQSPMKAKIAFATCATCHEDVHRGTFRQDCKACHNESGFQKAPFDHTQTKFALTGRHQSLTCAACHKSASPAPAPARARAASAPTPPAGRGTPARGRGTPPRGRATQAAGRVTPSADRPTASLADFRGLSATCVSCHADVHERELGATCESCHSTTTFRLPGYVHPRQAEFFAGQHAAVACDACHVPAAPTRPIRSDTPVLKVKFRETSTACVSCHRDVHIGQEGSQCESCHDVGTPRFALTNFSHARTGFQLTGRHETIACAVCHKVETGLFPAGQGTATRLKGIARDCRGCHADVHLGQLQATCETCHTTSSFHLQSYTHRSRSSSGFFTGRHERAACAACHKQQTAQFPAGRGTAVRFQIDQRCVGCHEDIHRGSLGPNCGTCHRP
jgi:hypothetical protein